MIERLEEIAKVLDEVQSKLNSIDANCPLAGELYDARCELEDIKEDLAQR